MDPVFMRSKQENSPYAMTERDHKGQRGFSGNNTERKDVSASKYCEACNPKFEDSPSRNMKKVETKKEKDISS